MLTINNLKTYYRTKAGYLKAVDGISFSLKQGENLGLVGESGCGKTTAAKSIMRLLANNASYQGGEILFKGRDILSLDRRQLNSLRWQEISMVSQSAMNALDPVYQVGDQIIEAIQIHEDVSKKEAYARAGELFSLVGLERNRLEAYPHELSGGMKQRVVIAMALALDPDLIIADEPTTALDVVVQDGILKQISLLQQKLNNSMIMVTHDISVVAETCPKIVVMYGGRVMEYGKTDSILQEPIHPYTMGLKNAFPTLEEAREELISIPGSPPDLVTPPTGCRFQERCPFSRSRCEEQPEGRRVGSDRIVFCHFTKEAAEYRQRASEPSLWRGEDNEKTSPARPERMNGRTVLKCSGLKRHFPLKSSLLDLIRGRPKRKLKAVDDISLEVASGEILGLAGESGSGKSTLGELLCMLQPATEGEIIFEGNNLSGLGGGRLKEFRRNFQMVFQDPYETLNPRFTVLNTIMEPLKIHGIGEGEEERIQMVREALEMAELTPPDQFFLQYPHQLSGGQRQRVALARAIVMKPEFIIADEPVSMLDVSIRAGVLNLLRRFRDQLGISIIYISHDLATIRYICDRTAILYLGRIMEVGPTEKVIGSSHHPYTRLLLNAVPRVEGKREHVDVEGEIPDPIDLPNGCRFHPRCAEAKADCGWEGRDLRQLLIKYREEAMISDDEPRFLQQIQEFQLEGLDLKIIFSGDDGEEIKEALRDFLQQKKEVMLKAVEQFEVGDRALVVSFPARDDQELLVMDAQDHYSACPYSK